MPCSARDGAWVPLYGVYVPRLELGGHPSAIIRNNVLFEELPPEVVGCVDVMVYKGGCVRWAAVRVVYV